MRFFNKLLYAVTGLIALIYIGVNVGILYTFVWQNSQFWMRYFRVDANLFFSILITYLIFAGITALAALVILGRGLFSKRRDSMIDLHTSDGRLQVTENAIRSTIRAGVHLFPVRLMDTRIHLQHKKRRLRAVVYLAAPQHTDTAALGSALAARLQQDLEQLTGIVPDRLQLVFQDIIDNEKAGDTHGGA